MEILSAIIIFAGSILLLGWLQKVLGVRMTSKTMKHHVESNSRHDVEDLKILNITAPRLVIEAINECERKFYRKTADNIMTEVYRIAKTKGINIENTLNDFRNSDNPEYLKMILGDDNYYKAKRSQEIPKLGPSKIDMNKIRKPFK